MAGYMSRSGDRLYRLNGIYRVRVQVPKELREIVGKREIKESLRTSDLNEAKKRLARALVRIDAQLDDARRLLANPEARARLLVRETIEEHRRRPRLDD